MLVLSWHCKVTQHGSRLTCPDVSVYERKYLDPEANLVIVDCQSFGYDDENDLSCFNTYDFNNKMFRDYTVGNAIDRQWNWMLCNEPFDYWQEYVIWKGNQVRR